MADDQEYANVTVGDKTFDIKVPKGASDDFINQAAQEYHQRYYANPVRPPNINMKEDHPFQTYLGSSSKEFDMPGWVAPAAAIATLGESALAAPLATATGLITGAGSQYLAKKLHAPEWAQDAAGIAGGLAGGFGSGKIKQVMANLPEDVIGNSTALKLLKHISTPSVELPPIVSRFKGPADELAGGINVPLRPPMADPNVPKVKINPTAASPNPNDFVPPPYEGGNAVTPPVPPTSRFQWNKKPSQPIVNIEFLKQLESSPVPRLNSPSGPVPIITPAPTPNVNQRPLLGPATHDFWRSPGSPVPEDPMEYIRRTGNIEEPTVQTPNPNNPAVRIKLQSPQSNDNSPWHELSEEEKIAAQKSASSTPKIQQVPPAMESVNNPLTKNLELSTDSSEAPKKSDSVSASAESDKDAAAADSKPAASESSNNKELNPIVKGLKDRGVIKSNPKVEVPGRTNTDIQNEDAKAASDRADKIAKDNIPKLDKYGNKLKKEVKVKHPDKPKIDPELEKQTAETAKKPYFTRALMRKISDALTTKDNVITLGEVGRYIHNNPELGTYEAAHRGLPDYGASRINKTNRTVGSNQVNQTLIKAGIKHLMQEHPEWF